MAQRAIEQNQRSKRISDIILSARKDHDLDPSDRLLGSDEEVLFLVNQAKSLGREVVLTQGTFDLVHIGHARYAREARKHGDLLIIGIDDDVKARSRKGENRPVVPFTERAEIMCHLRYVDAVVLKGSSDEKWHLIKIIHPNTLIAVEGTYTEQDILDLQSLCEKVVVLPRQAETSTSAKARKLVLDGAENITRILSEMLPDVVRSAYERMKEDKA